MYTFDEVKAALEAGPLDEALAKLELYGQTNGHDELVKWCSSELSGYEAADTAAQLGRTYRETSAIVLRHGVAVHAGKLYINQGVDALAPYEKQGLQFADSTGSLPPGHVVQLPMQSIAAVFNGIRAEAKRRFVAVAGMKLARPLARTCPDFTKLVTDPNLASILEGRWREANLAYGVGAYISAVIQLGSILEGVLLAKAEANRRVAMTSSSAPTDKKTGATLPLDQWKLASLIAVAHAVGWLGKDVKDFSIALREYRNFVHPNVQRTQRFDPDVGTCDVAWAVTSAALADLT